MSGAEDLARLTVTIDTADEIFLSSEIKDVDVGNGETRPTVAKALSIAATQLGGSMPWPSVAIALENTVNGAFFSVPSAEPLKYIDMYRNDDGAVTYVDTYPNSEALVAVTSQIQSFPSTDPAIVRLSQVDKEGTQIFQLTDKELNTIPFIIRIDQSSTSICDREGAIAFLDDALRTIVGPFEMQKTDAPGVFATDVEGALLGVEDEVVPQSPFDGGLLFSPVLATSSAIESVIYPQNILQYRDRDSAMIATLSSTTTSKSSSGRALPVDAASFGPGVTLGLRRLDAALDHRFMQLTLVDVPIQSPAVPIKVLVIGDSIGNRQGATLIKQYLEAQGFTVTFTGTMPGSALANDPNDATGGLGEAREGWETGDYTYAQTDMASIVAPGTEAAYLSGSKAYKYSRNPFLRAATGDDDSSIVRNGYVFDAAFYQSRFGLQAPDVVLSLLGTNDASHRTDATVYAEVLANDTLMNAQMSEAWPNAKIIRALPGTAFDTNRNALWSTRYAPVIRAIKDAAAANPAVIVAPVWAMTDPEGGYPLPVVPAGSDGFLAGNFSDATHPAGSSRHSLFASLAPFLAAAALALI